MSYLHELAEAQRHTDAHPCDRRREEWAQVREDIDTLTAAYANHPSNPWRVALIRAYRAGFARAAAQAVPRSAETLRADHWNETEETSHD